MRISNAAVTTSICAHYYFSSLVVAQRLLDLRIVPDKLVTIRQYVPRVLYLFVCDASIVACSLKDY
jgi:hypothetical protein